MERQSLRDEIRDQLQVERRPAPLRAIADDAGVGYEWLCKFTHGHIDDPGVTKLERVRDALAGFSRRKRSAA